MVITLLPILVSSLSHWVSAVMTGQAVALERYSGGLCESYESLNLLLASAALRLALRGEKRAWRWKKKLEIKLRRILLRKSIEDVIELLLYTLRFSLRSFPLVTC